MIPSKDRVYIYGMDGNRIVRWSYIDKNGMRIADIRRAANALRVFNPAISEVYVVDNTPELKEACYSLTHRGWLEDQVTFKVFLQETGLKID